MEKKMTGIRIDGDLIRDLKKLALDLDTTYTALVEEGIRLVLEKHAGGKK